MYYHINQPCSPIPKIFYVELLNAYLQNLSSIILHRIVDIYIEIDLGNSDENAYI